MRITLLIFFLHMAIVAAWKSCPITGGFCLGGMFVCVATTTMRGTGRITGRGR